MAVRRHSIVLWQGLRTDIEPHLLVSGELSDCLNFRTDTGALKTRPGFEVEERTTGADQEKWPMVLWSRANPVPAATGSVRNVNGGVICGMTDGDDPKLLGGSASMWDDLAGLPDFAQLGARLFVCDGQNANTAIDQDGTVRPMGAQGQRGTLSLTQGTSGALTPEAHYVFGVQRILVKGLLEVPSPVLTGAITLAAGATPSVSVGIVEYEESLPAGWTEHYRIYRSQSTSPATLYRVEMVTTSGDLEAYQATYVDDDADAALDLTNSYDATSGDTNYPFPPVRFMRAYQGRIVAGGSYSATGAVATSAASATATPASGVREADRDAQVRIEGEPSYFLVTAVDTAAGTWTLDRACANTAAAARFVKLHADDVIYISNALPGNIEGYTYGGEVYANAEAGNRVTGIAESAGIVYILREHRVETLDDMTDPELVALPDSPPGCVSHATIADRYSRKVYYYAGESGVVELVGGEAQIVSDPVRDVIENDVDHDYDAWTHGVYDPRTALYHLWLFHDGGDDTGTGFRIPSLMLTYDTRRQRWYRGELSATVSGVWKDSNGHPYAVIGIGGGVAKLDVGTVDGDWYAGTVTSGAASVVTDSGADFETEGPGLAGLPVYVTHADGTVERRIISENQTTQLEVYGTFDATPAEDDTYTVGAIRWVAETGEIDFSDQEAGGPFEAEHLFERAVFIHDPANLTASVTITEARATTRTDSAKEIAGSLDFNYSRNRLRGAEIGLRADGARVRMTGIGSVKILKVLLEATETKR